MNEPPGLSAQEIAEEVAQVGAAIMQSEMGDHAPSLTFPRGFFEREIIERVEVIWGLRRVAVPNVILQVDFNLDEFPPLADCVRRSLVSAMVPFLEGCGGVLQNTPEGVIVILGQEGAVDGYHAQQFSPASSVLSDNPQVS